MRYLLSDCLRRADGGTSLSGDDRIVELISAEDCLRDCAELPHFSLLQKCLPTRQLEYCKAELMSGCVIGTLVIPNKENPARDMLSVAYYMTRDRLIFIDTAEHLPALQRMAEQIPIALPMTTVHFFLDFLEYLIQNDMRYLQNFEKRLSVIEDALLNKAPKNLPPTIIRARRELLVMNSYYLQIMDMAAVQLENQNQFFTPEELQLISVFSNRIDRLYDHTQMLREYALQIREMHQSQLDIRQNDTMRILTVVTTLFFPLSLLAGWYGMNFAHMPELESPYGYLVIILVSVLIILAEIWYFKKKDWL